MSNEEQKRERKRQVPTQEKGMEKDMQNGFEEIVAKVKECGKKKISVAAAQDSAVLEAVREAKARGIADAVLVGDEAKIRSKLFWV